MNVKNIKGRTEYNSGQFVGYVLWKQSDGFHLRWTTKGSKPQNFQGKIICEDKVMITKRVRPKTKVDTREKNTIGWDAILEGQEDGFDFRTPGNFTVDLRIKKKKIKTKNIFLGPNLTQPESNPFTIIQKIAERKLEVDTKKVKKEPKKKVEKVIKETKPEPEPEPVYEPTPEPEPEPVYEPTPEPEPEPVYEPTPEPEPEPVYEPTPEPEPEPVYEPTPEPEPEPVYEPTPEPEPEPVYEPTPEPEPEPVYEPTPEPEIEPETRITAWLNQLQTYRKYEPEADIEPEPVYEPTPEPEIEKTEESEEETSENESIEE